MPTDISVAFVEPQLLGQHGLGVIAPFDFALDRELWRWVPDDVSLHLTRLPYTTTPVTVEMAKAISDTGAVWRATRDVLTPEPKVVAYACTSGSFVYGAAGERRLAATMVAAGAPTAITTSGAVVDALAELGVRRLALATPYIDSVTGLLGSFLAECGVRVVASHGLGLLNRIWKVSYREVVQAVCAVDRPEAEAMFISCTNLPTYDVIPHLEHILGKPVLTANQVTMWSALRTMGREAAGAEQLLVQHTRPSAA